MSNQERSSEPQDNVIPLFPEVAPSYPDDEDRIAPGIPLGLFDEPGVVIVQRLTPDTDVDRIRNNHEALGRVVEERTEQIDGHDVIFLLAFEPEDKRRKS